MLGQTRRCFLYSRFLLLIGMQVLSNGRRAFFASIVFLAFVFGSVSVFAQQTDFAAERERAVQMINNGKYVESLPLFEKLAAAKEADAEIFFGLGIALLSKADQTNDVAARKALRVKARNALSKAKEMGVQNDDLDMILSGIKPDGGDRGKSDSPQANQAMSEAFAAFSRQDYSKAAELYEKAAKLDPSLYEAALYTGNSFYGAKKYDQAGIWFAKAIAIDPNRETAYRYWADGLWLSGKDKEAIDKYFDAIIAEPYSSMPWRGLIQYAQRNNIKLAHPKIDVPVNVSSSENGNTSMTLGMGEKTDDGAFAWTAYGLSRAAWQTGKDGKLSKDFSKAYPDEKTYRRSLAEETAALRSVLTVLKESKDAKKLNPSLALLQKLNNEGLLEAYVLFARADAGVKQDYPAFRQNNRDKLKRYLSEYVMKNGGN